MNMPELCKRDIPEELVEKTREWLGVDGLKFFRDVKEKYGEVAAVWMDGPIPHAVHFREGMQVRNFMRETGLCEDWTHHELDDNWEDLIEKVIINEA